MNKSKAEQSGAWQIKEKSEFGEGVTVSLQERDGLLMIVITNKYGEIER